jgi:hypothetical protein
MKEQFTVYVAKSGERYIQTKNFRLADALAYLTGARYYKLDRPSGQIFSFQYSNELMDIVNNLDSFRIY